MNIETVIVRRSVDSALGGARGESFFAAARRKGALGAVPVPADATDEEILALATGSELEASDLFAARPITNLANPGAYDPSLATVADQMHRVWNPPGVSGSLAAQNSTTLPVYGVSRGIDVSSIPVGDPIRISIDGAPTGMKVHFTDPTPFLDWYKADRTFKQGTTTGFVRATGDRSFVITAGRPNSDCKYITLNFADTTASAAVPLTEERMQALIDNLIVHAGDEAIDFVPYAAPGSYDLAAAGVERALGADGPVKVALQAGIAFVRTGAQASETYDFCERAEYGENVSYPWLTGPVDFLGRRAVLKATSALATIAGYNLAPIQTNGMDEGAPVHINGHYLGEGHGMPGRGPEIAGHGLTVENIGAVAHDAAGKAWVAAYIISSSRVLWIPDNTGAADKWVCEGHITGTTLTWVSGGPDFGTLNITGADLPEQPQLVPIIRDLEKTLLLDGNVISGDGVYSGQKNFAIKQSYDLVNIASMLDYLKGRAGESEPPDYVHPDIPTQVRFTMVYVWDRFGARLKHSVIEALQAYRRAAFGTPGDYHGDVQAQRPSLTTDTPPGFASRVDMFVARLTGTVAGYDLTARANVTANTSFIRVPRSLCADPSNPASYMAMIGMDGSGNDLFGFAIGNSRHVGVGTPAARAAATNTICCESSAEKSYWVLIDSAAGDAVVGETIVSTTFCAPWIAERQDLTIPGIVIPNAAGGYDCIIAGHETISRSWVKLPADLVGRAVTVSDPHANVTLHSDVVTPKGVQISIAGQGDVILSIAAA